jgi:hypothetical protein
MADVLEVDGVSGDYGFPGDNDSLSFVVINFYVLYS